ncbi:hypothetical protein TNCT_197671 [Trichonephila clavata]|uniref:Uncharacterized protein n=1 Tax=Trichonephila clavata TaxID=2740835 RepID=A0A8X6GJC2_TRICU|nr:hypothetical protein TNCT_197671 [Trichonephila clavata]
MQFKNEVSKCLETFLNEAKNAEHMVKEVLSDGGGEVINSTVKSVLEKSGISSQKGFKKYSSKIIGCGSLDAKTLKMEDWKAILENILQERVTLRTVCDGITVGRKILKNQVEVLEHCAKCLQALVRCSQEEFFYVLQGSMFADLRMEIKEHLEYVKDLVGSIERSRDYLSDIVQHPEFLPPAEQEFNRLKNRYRLAENDVILWLAYVEYRYNNE